MWYESVLPSFEKYPCCVLLLNCKTRFKREQISFAIFSERRKYGRNYYYRSRQTAVAEQQQQTINANCQLFKFQGLKGGEGDRGRREEVGRKTRNFMCTCALLMNIAGPLFFVLCLKECLLTRPVISCKRKVSRDREILANLAGLSGRLG